MGEQNHQEGPTGFRRLLATDTFTIFGVHLLSVALPLYVLDMTGSAAAAAGVALTRALPVAVLGMVGGVLADRFDTRRLLVGATAARTLCVLPLLIPLSSSARVGVVYAVALLIAVLSALAQPVVGACLPLVVRPDDLPTSNAKLTARTVFVQLLAPSAGAVIYAQEGLTGVAITNAILFALGCVTAATLRLPERPRPAAEAWRRRLLGGLATLRADPALRTVLVAALIAILGLSLELALLVPYVREVLEGSKASVGLLTTSSALGGLVGAGCVACWGRRAGPRRLVTIGMFGMPISSLALLLSSSVPQAVPGLMLAGLLLTVLTTGFQTLVQTTVPITHLGRVLGAFAAAFGGAAVIGAASAAMLVAPLGLRGCVGLAAAVELVGLAYYLVRRRSCGRCLDGHRANRNGRQGSLGWRRPARSAVGSG